MKIIYSFILPLSFLLIQGCSSSEPDMDQIAKKIVKVETPHGKYTTRNKSSGAYGRYQIMPGTARYYTKKLDMNHYYWKKPENQDKIFKAILTDNICSLEKNGHKINAFTVYGCHQQGATGFNNIVTNTNMTDRMYYKLRRNLPKKYKHVKKENLRDVWLNYWQNKMS